MAQVLAARTELQSTSYNCAYGLLILQVELQCPNRWLFQKPYIHIHSLRMAWTIKANATPLLNTLLGWFLPEHAVCSCGFPGTEAEVASDWQAPGDMIRIGVIAPFSWLSLLQSRLSFVPLHSQNCEAEETRVQFMWAQLLLDCRVHRIKRFYSDCITGEA